MTTPEAVPTRLGMPGVSLSHLIFSSSQTGVTSAGTSTSFSSSQVLTSSSTITTESVTPSSSGVIPNGDSGSSPSTLQAGAGQSFGQASRDAHVAVIISLVTLCLIVMLTILLFIWCYIRRRRKSPTQIELQSPRKFEFLKGWTRTDTTDTRRQSSSSSHDVAWAQEAGHERGGGGGSGDDVEEFNPMDMVVERSAITSTAWSQDTLTSGLPPPPYGRTASPRDDAGIIHRHTISRRGSSISGVRPSTVTPKRHEESSTKVDDEVAMEKRDPSWMIVEYTFTPTDSDELEVKRGDRLRVTGIFDDGWCLCRTETGMVGVVPTACFQSRTSMSTGKLMDGANEPGHQKNIGTEASGGGIKRLTAKLMIGREMDRGLGGQ